MKEQAVISPTALAVFLSLSVVAFILIGAGAVGASVWMSAHAVHAELANAAANAVRQCMQLRTLDNARTAIGFPDVNTAHPSELYLSRLASGIHGFYENSGCKAVLAKAHR